MNEVKGNLITVGVVVLLWAGFALGVLLPGRRSLSEKQQRVEATAQRVRSEYSTVVDMSAVFAEILRLEQDNAHYRERIPSERRFGEFLNNLSQCLQTAGIADFVVEPRPEQLWTEQDLPDELKSARGMTLLRVRVTFQGKFDNLFDFLSAVEAIPRLSHVESMTVRNQEEQIGRIDAEIILRTYYKPDEGAPFTGAQG